MKEVTGQGRAKETEHWILSPNLVLHKTCFQTISIWDKKNPAWGMYLRNGNVTADHLSFFPQGAVLPAHGGLSAAPDNWLWGTFPHFGHRPLGADAECPELWFGEPWILLLGEPWRAGSVEDRWCHSHIVMVHGSATSGFSTDYISWQVGIFTWKAEKSYLLLGFMEMPVYVFCNFALTKIPFHPHST